MHQLHEVSSEIQRRRHFLITSHARPDGDAVGSAIALGQILRALGKRVDVVLHDPVPVIYKGLPFAETVIHASEAREYDAAIILECDNIHRTRLQGLEGKFLINIDHHASSKPFANVNWIDANASSVAEMIFRLAQALTVEITPEIATCLYTAVLTDTGAFCYSPTNACTFELARNLVERGADPARIAQGVYFSSPIAKMKLLGVALSSLQREGVMTWMAVTRQDMDRFGALDEDCEGLVNYALGIAGIEVAVFFREVAQGRTRVSIRSKGGINVAPIAEKFGGGGHECASGFSVEGPANAAEERVLAELRRHMPPAS